jgi:taurine transport system ATP-binding protein
MKSLDVRDVVVTYSGASSGVGDVTALDHVSLTIEPGSFVVALGASGCGKTTLLNLMAGFLKPTSGSVSFDGRIIEKPSSERGVVFQHGALMPWLNVLDNVAFGLKLKGVRRNDRHDRARAMIRLVDLEGVEDRRIWELSGGMRQRVGVARALTADPDVLLMDEPLGALDALTREQMQELILDVWARTGKSVFFITHGIDEAVFLASKLLVMSPRPGRVVAALDLGFGRQFAAGAKSGDVKSQPEFVAVRERVKGLIFSSRQLAEASP